MLLCRTKITYPSTPGLNFFSKHKLSADRDQHGSVRERSRVHTPQVHFLAQAYSDRVLACMCVCICMCMCMCAYVYMCICVIWLCVCICVCVCVCARLLTFDFELESGTARKTEKSFPSTHATRGSRMKHFSYQNPCDRPATVKNFLSSQRKCALNPSFLTFFLHFPNSPHQRSFLQHAVDWKKYVKLRFFIVKYQNGVRDKLVSVRACARVCVILVCVYAFMCLSVSVCVCLCVCACVYM
jgi:hypothetical protein